MIAGLDAWRQKSPRAVAEESNLPRLRAAATRMPENSPAEPALVVLVRTLTQLDAAIEAYVAEIYVDLHDIRELRAATERVHRGGAKIWLATPRIQKPAELGIFHAMLKHQADGILVRNLAGLSFFVERQVPVIADFSLNVANELTADVLLKRGACYLVPSYDLNRDQLLDLIDAAPAERIEVVVHQHMPMFHMEHCVFCAVLSPGTNKTNCGRPCDRHTVQLRDQLGVEHSLTADVGCRNTLFNATCQSGAEIVRPLIERGVRRFRLEFLEESSEQIDTTIGLYRRLLNGEISGRHVWTQLKATNRVGVTRGTLESSRDPLAII
jgi:putative protease